MQLKSGDWCNLMPPDSEMTTLELANLIGEVYDLEAAVIDRLEFSFTTFIGSKGNTKIVVFNEHQTIREIVRIHKDPTVQQYRPLHLILMM